MFREFGLQMPIHAPFCGVFGVEMGQMETLCSNFQSPMSYGHDPYACKKIKVKGQFVENVKCKQTDGKDQKHYLFR